MTRMRRLLCSSTLLGILTLANGCGGSADRSPPGTPATPPPGAPLPTGTLPDGLEAAIDEVASGVVDPSGAASKTVGLVIGVVTPKYQLVRGYGVTELGGTTTPSHDTIFELGSVTKVFTGALLAEDVLKGGVTLDDEVVRLLPAGVTVPSFGARAITLLDLATHTSGLPTMPDNLPGQPPNPGAGYTAEQLYEFLGRYQLTTEPGTKYVYGNLGFGLLGRAILLHRAAPSYDAMIEGLFGHRLAMHDTHIERRQEDSSRMATGHRDAKVMPPGQIDTLEGSGALRSTADDMLRLLRGAIGLDPALKDILDMVEVPRRDSPAGKVGLGLEQQIDDALGVIYMKGGGMPGFSSYVAYTKETPIGVVVLANSFGFGARPLAEQVLRIAAAKSQ